MAVIQKRQAWAKPVTRERVDISFDGKVTRVQHGGKVTELSNPPWNEEEAKAAARESLKPMFAWSPFQVDSWRDQLIGGNSQDVAVAKAAFLAAGMPAKLWDDIDVYKRMMGFTPAAEPNQPMTAPEGGWSVQIVEAGQPVPNLGDGTIVIHADDPALKDNLLFHPSPEVKEAFENLYLQQNVGVSEPPADALFTEQVAKLNAEGFVHLSVREVGGELYLPPGLAQYRAQLKPAIKPLLRLAADKSRKPKPWETKVGGAPYRPQGQPWPVTLDDKATPLAFLAQINYGELNDKGAVLADHPSQGLLQIFISNTEFYGVASEELGHINPDIKQRFFRVTYIAEVVENAAALDASVPEIPVDPNGYMLPYDAKIETALLGIPDEETITACDVGASAVTGIKFDDYNDPAVAEVRDALWDVAVAGHKVGGYPNFTQQDPRKADDDHILLLQLDSDQALGLMWGDVGIANFFIRPADLKARDFSRVNFNWDCG
jgi:uncharacterized protein YwqG